MPNLTNNGGNDVVAAVPPSATYMAAVVPSKFQSTDGTAIPRRAGLFVHRCRYGAELTPTTRSSTAQQAGHDGGSALYKVQTAA